jgi:tetratricopeptide (TPR) repeat protein
VNIESENSHEDQEMDEALLRYEEMLRKGDLIYFDVYQIEHIVERFLEEEKIYPAMQAIEMGMDIHPGAISLKIIKVTILLNLGEIIRALALANEMLLIEKTNKDLHLLKGSAHILLDETTLADDSFQLALKYSIDDRDEMIFNIGFAYEQNDYFKEAIAYFEKTIELNPENEAAIYELAYCYEKINQNEKSIEYYNKYIDIDTFSDSAWFNIGFVYAKLNKFEKSIEAYEYALAINEDFPNAWFNLGHSYMFWKKYQNAIDSFNRLLEFDPTNDDIICLIGDCNTKLKKYDTAYNDYQQAIKLNDKNDKAWFGSGSILRTQEDYIKSIEFLRKAVKIAPENSEYQFLLAKVTANLQYHKESTEAYEKACELNPEKLKYWLSFSGMLYKKGLIQKAISTLNLGFEHHPDNPLLNYRLAAYLLEAGNEEQAFEHLENALKMDYQNHNYLFESFPEAKNNESIKKMIRKFKPINL